MSLSKQHDIWAQIRFPRARLDFVLSLYDKYQTSLQLVRQQQEQLYSIRNDLGLVPQLGDLEAEITYLLLREAKPWTVVEISPASGWSTTWILQALKDNGMGVLHSFDLVDDSTRIVPEHLKEERWIFHKGDVRANIDLIPKGIQYLFLDSDHSRNFANWYIHNLFPILQKGTGISVHDILKLSNEPGWGEESIILCQYLAENGIACSTASRALRHLGFDPIMNFRKALNITGTIHPPDYNSMVFFEL